MSLTTAPLSISEKSASGSSIPSAAFSSCTDVNTASLNVFCSRSLQKLMQSCSSELTSNDSNPKMSDADELLQGGGVDVRGQAAAAAAAAVELASPPPATSAANDLLICETSQSSKCCRWSARSRSASRRARACWALGPIGAHLGHLDSQRARASWSTSISEHSFCNTAASPMLASADHGRTAARLARRGDDAPGRSRGRERCRDDGRRGNRPAPARRPIPATPGSQSGRGTAREPAGGGIGASSADWQSM